MGDYRFKRGDVVRVYSLQSFHGGGFLNGTEGVVAQDQIGGSVQVVVRRLIRGAEAVDPSYEVYPEQLRIVSLESRRDKFIGRLEQLIADLKGS